MADYKLLLGDCVEKMKELPDNSVDSIVTDSPYELGFMGKRWDSTGIAFNVDMWKECLRVLKPGGHLLSAGGTRTYHRMTCAIEDAGFEVRDSIQWWHYSSGFPKSHNVTKKLGLDGPMVGTALKPAGEPFISATKDGGDIMLADEPGFFYGAKVAKKDRNEGLEDTPDKELHRMREGGGGLSDDPRWKPVTTKNNHPTVKPTNLMRYLVKLVTPKGGTVLDPFMGSGSTGKACMIEGFNFIGIEREKEYMDIAEARIKKAKELEDNK
jgi:site-specific DNA-methyltransferase (adenine-specific)